jgi:hypothetical protein
MPIIGLGDRIPAPGGRSLRNAALKLTDLYGLSSQHETEAY